MSSGKDELAIRVARSSNFFHVVSATKSRGDIGKYALYMYFRTTAQGSIEFSMVYKIEIVPHYIHDNIKAIK